MRNWSALPDERYGLAFVFRVFDRVSYALVMHVSRPVNTWMLSRLPSGTPAPLAGVRPQCPAAGARRGFRRSRPPA